MTGPRAEDFPEFPAVGGDYSGFTDGLEQRGSADALPAVVDMHVAVEKRLLDRLHELEAEVVRLKQDRQDAQDSVRDWVKWYIRHHVVPPNQFEPDPNEEKADA